ESPRKDLPEAKRKGSKGRASKILLGGQAACASRLSVHSQGRRKEDHRWIVTAAPSKSASELTHPIRQSPVLVRQSAGPLPNSRGPSGNTAFLSGDTSLGRSPDSGLSGNTSGLSGNTSFLSGDTSLRRSPGSGPSGYTSGLSGNTSFLSGDTSLERSPGSGRGATEPFRPPGPLPRPLSRASPTHPSRTGEGRHRPTPTTSNKKTEGSCFRVVAPSPARGGGRWHARGRVGEGAGGGKARSS